MQYLVLKELPLGNQPGTIVELHEAVGDVFVLVGAVEPVPTGFESQVEAPVKAPTTRGRYRRHDLQAN